MSILAGFVGAIVGFMYGCYLTYRNHNLFTGKLRRFNREESLKKKTVAKS